VSVSPEPGLVQSKEPASVQKLAGPSYWRHSLMVLLALAGTVLALYWRTAVEMAGIWWRSDTYAHAMLVPPLVLWLVWRQRQLLAGLQPRPFLPGVPVLLLAASLWWAGSLLQSNVLTQYALVSMLVALVLLVLGPRLARALWFPLVFAYFAVPAGEVLVPWLMEGTADFTVAAVRLSGVPVYRDGLNFVIPSGSWSVVEACSGVRYLIASFMVGTLFAYLNYQRTWRRLAFIGVSLLVPIVANWLRAYMIVMLGHLSGNQLAVGVDHLLYGWVFFGVVMLLTYWLGTRWTEDEPSLAAAPDASGSSGVAPSFQRQAGVAVLALALLAWPALQWRDRQAASREVALALPVELPGGWHSDPSADVGWQPMHHKPLAQVTRNYRVDLVRVGVDLAYYRQQDRASKLVSSTNRLVSEGDANWERSPLGQVQVPWRKGTVEFRATRLVNRSGSHADRLVWQTYWVDGEFTPDDLQARLRLAWNLARGHGDDSARVTLHTDIDQPETAVKRLQAFAETALPQLQAGLEAARGARP
jgi:exosortase A